MSLCSKGAFSEIAESQSATEGWNSKSSVQIRECIGTESVEICDVLLSVDQHFRLSYRGEFLVDTPTPMRVTLEKMKQICVLLKNISQDCRGEWLLSNLCLTSFAVLIYSRDDQISHSLGLRLLFLVIRGSQLMTSEKSTKGKT